MTGEIFRNPGPTNDSWYFSSPLPPSLLMIQQRRDLYMLGKCSITELHPYPSYLILNSSDLQIEVLLGVWQDFLKVTCPQIALRQWLSRFSNPIHPCSWNWSNIQPACLWSIFMLTSTF
jgi:hypothetical protein